VKSATHTQIEEHYLCLMSVGLLQGRMPLTVSKVGRIGPITNMYQYIFHLCEQKHVCGREGFLK